MAITATELRANLYRILDRVAETGEPVEIDRGGRILRIVPAARKGVMKRLVRRPGFFKCDPDSIVHMDWSGEWKP
jgi:prevent-host-death family protein